MEVLKSEDENFLIGIPDVFNGLDEYTNVSAKFWKSFVGQYYNDVLKIVPVKKVYGNTNCTRFYSGYKDKCNCLDIVELYKKIWEDRNIICIEGDKTRMGVGNDLFNNTKSFKRILAPAENAYNVRIPILNYLKENKFDKRNLFVIALGPTATVLAYDLHKLGYQSLDLGHLDIQYEYAIRQADGKIKIEGKYTNEAKGGNVVTNNICDEEYFQSIIAKFV